MEKVDRFCQKLEAMIKEISSNEFSLSLGISNSAMPVLMLIYRSALERYMEDRKCAEVLERIFTESEHRDLQKIFAESTEDDLQTLGHFAETFLKAGKVQESTQLFQFLIFLCPNGRPNSYAYLNLAESLSALNANAGLQMYDFILNIFPDNPSILLSASKCYYEGDRPRQALRVLSHAKEICEHNVATDPTLQNLLDLLNPELEKVQRQFTSKE